MSEVVDEQRADRDRRRRAPPTERAPRHGPAAADEHEERRAEHDGQPRRAGDARTGGRRGTGGGRAARRPTGTPASAARPARGRVVARRRRPRRRRRRRIARRARRRPPAGPGRPRGRGRGTRCVPSWPRRTRTPSRSRRRPSSRAGPPAGSAAGRAPTSASPTSIAPRRSRRSAGRSRQAPRPPRTAARTTAGQRREREQGAARGLAVASSSGQTSWKKALPGDGRASAVDRVADRRPGPRGTRAPATRSGRRSGSARGWTRVDDQGERDAGQPRRRSRRGAAGPSDGRSRGGRRATLCYPAIHLNARAGGHPRDRPAHRAGRAGARTRRRGPPGRGIGVGAILVDPRARARLPAHHRIPQLPGSGFKVDLDSFRLWAEDLAEQGLTASTTAASSTTTRPATSMSCSWSASSAAPLGGIGDLIKIPPILADIALGWLVWSMARELGGSARRARSSAPRSCVVNPVTWFDSVVWGQVDSFGVVFLLLGCASCGATGRSGRRSSPSSRR